MRDIVYFDESKAASLHSQLVGGLTTGITASEQEGTDKAKGAEIDAHLINLQLSSNRSSGVSYSETKILHHDILGRLEKLLFEKGFAIDVNESVSSGTINGSIFRDLIKDISYIRIESEAVFHDHSRLIEIVKHFPQLIEFVSRCAIDNFQKSDSYGLLATQIAEQKSQAKTIKDKNKKSKVERQIKQLEQDLHNTVEKAVGEGMPEPWLLEGISNWINLFNPEHLHVRLSVPNATDGSQVVANLKRDCFVDSSFDHIVFAYGRKTNVKLTLLGLITSIPQDPETERATIHKKPISFTNSDLHVFENAFANVFESVSEIEKFALVDNYPNIKVYPVAVYRSVSSYFGEPE
jgi:hypothetical protein